MTQKLTPEKLLNFAKAVEELAHEHLGANGVKGIAVGLNYSTYNDFRKVTFTDKTLVGEVIEHPEPLPYEGLTFYGFVTVGYVENFPAFKATFKFR